MSSRRYRDIATLIALLLSAAQAGAQVVRPVGLSSNDVPVRDWGRTASPAFAREGSRLAADTPWDVSQKGVRTKPIVIGTVVGALLGAGMGWVVALGCDSPGCSKRGHVVAGTLIGAGAGSVFGLLLGLPPKER